MALTTPLAGDHCHCPSLPPVSGPRVSPLCERAFLMRLSSFSVSSWPCACPPNPVLPDVPDERHSKLCGAALPLFLLQLALRIEIADAAALAAGRRVEHRVDECRLAGIHGGVNGALELVRGRRVEADA